MERVMEAHRILFPELGDAIDETTIGASRQ
jgi:hypothetical protein